MALSPEPRPPAEDLVLSPEKLRRRCNPDRLGFETTDQVEICDQIVGQHRAVDALRMGLEIQGQGYNIFVSGPAGTGRTTTVKCLLGDVEKQRKPPDDKCYVNNFADPDQPSLLCLPAGQGRKLQKDMDEVIDYLVKSIPAALESDTFERRRNAIVEDFKARSTARVREFERRVQEAGFALVQVAPGSKPELVPMVDGKPSGMDDLRVAVEEGRAAREYYDKLATRYHDLQDELNMVFKEMRANERAAREALTKLEKEMVRQPLHDRLAEVREHYSNDKVSRYLDQVETAVLNEPGRFREKPPAEANAPMPVPVGDQFLEFRVNVLVDNTDEKDAPIVFETSPTYKNLFGTIERIWDRSGQWRTDFTKVKGGSLLRADGGFLVMNALDLFMEPGVWPTLKRTLRNRVIEIQSYDQFTMLAMSAIKPEPIEVDVKVILIGDSEVYEILYHQDEDFRKLFKIRSDFDWEMPATEESVRQYATLIRTLCTRHSLRPFDRTGVAAVVECGMRLAGRADKVTTRFNVISDLLKEADYWAGKAAAPTVRAEHFERAIAERRERAGLIEEKLQEMIDRGAVLIDTQGSAVGQVNGLAVYDTGELTFGKPARITAKVGVGGSGIINIEREAQLSGRLHDKGVLILAGFLRDRFAQDKPLAMSASICFEQSYSGVEGDSASSTEVYALLSALSGLPLRQDLAVTGSVNQQGEIQPIGGVNQKIEGFFDVCCAQGLTGTQGVIIPVQNAGDLMLRHDVVEAAAAGKFRIYAVRTIDQGIELLTGTPAGARAAGGRYPDGSVYARVDRRLAELAAKWQAFNQGAGPAAH